VLGDRTEATDCAKPWNDLCDSISFVLCNPGRALMEHCRRLRRRLLWVSPTTIAMTPQAETDALWKIYQLHGLARSYCRHVRDSIKNEPSDDCFGKLYEDKIHLVVVARERRGRIMYVSHLRD
jgi:hypothetical protein